MAKLIYESQESLYEKACAVTRSIDYIVQYRFKAENYQKAADMFRQVGNYLDAPQRVQECEAQAQKLLDDEKDYRYQEAVEHLAQAVDVPDYENAAGAFRELKGYKDSDTLLADCEKKKSAILNRRKRKVVSIIVVLAAAAVLCALFLRSSLWGRLKADIMDETYVDKSLPRYQQEQVLMNAAKTGDIVAFGPYEWKVLSKTDNSLTMIVAQTDESKLLKGRPWQAAEVQSADAQAAEAQKADAQAAEAQDAEAQSADAQEAEAQNTEAQNTEVQNTEAQNASASFEQSSLYAWLNGAFLEEGFDPEELEMIAGPVSVLSLDDLITYRKILKDYRQNAWLQDAGETPQTAAYMGPGGKGYSFGYPVTSDLLRVYPVITVEA